MIYQVDTLDATLRTVSLRIPHLYLKKTLGNAVHFLNLTVDVNLSEMRDMRQDVDTYGLFTS